MASSSSGSGGTTPPTRGIVPLNETLEAANEVRRLDVAVVHENQRWYPVKGYSSNVLPSDRCGAWSDSRGCRVADLASAALPPGGHAWAGKWALDLSGTRDADGWRYAAHFTAEWLLDKQRHCVVRRRR